MDNKDKDIDIDNNVPNCANNGKELTTNDIVETVAVSNADPNHSGQQLQDKKVEQSTAEVKPTTSDAAKVDDTAEAMSTTSDTAKDDDTAEAMSTTSDTAKDDGIAEIKPITNGDTKAQQNAQEVLSTNTEAMEEDDSNAWWKAYLPDAETKGETSKAKGKASATSSVENVSQYGADPEVGNVLKPEFENMKFTKRMAADSASVTGGNGGVFGFLKSNILFCVGVIAIIAAIVAMIYFAPSQISYAKLCAKIQPSEYEFALSTTKDVKRILGKPTAVEESQAGDTWYYYQGKVATLYKKGAALEEQMANVTSLEALAELMEKAAALEEEIKAIGSYTELKVKFSKEKNSNKNDYLAMAVSWNSDNTKKKKIKSFEFKNWKENDKEEYSTEINVIINFDDGSYQSGYVNCYFDIETNLSSEKVTLYFTDAFGVYRKMDKSWHNGNYYEPTNSTYDREDNYDTTY